MNRLYEVAATVKDTGTSTAWSKLIDVLNSFPFILTILAVAGVAIVVVSWVQFIIGQNGEQKPKKPIKMTLIGVAMVFPSIIGPILTLILNGAKAVIEIVSKWA